jgi:hypothetical protein
VAACASTRRRATRSGGSRVGAACHGGRNSRCTASLHIHPRPPMRLLCAGRSEKAGENAGTLGVSRSSVVRSSISRSCLRGGGVSPGACARWRPRRLPAVLPAHLASAVARGTLYGSPLNVTQRALSVTQRALSVTQRALSVTQRALSVTQRALGVTQRALSVTQQTHLYGSPLRRRQRRARRMRSTRREGCHLLGTHRGEESSLKSWWEIQPPELECATLLDL